MNLSLQNQQQQDWRKWIVITVILLLLAISHWSCHVQQRIEEAKIEAVKLDRLEHPCTNDTLLRLIPGEILIQHDTTSTLCHDSIYNWNYDTVRITKTIHQRDTIQITVKDVYLINSLKDSVNVHRLAQSNLTGQLSQEKINTITAEKLAKNRLAIIIAILSFIALVLGVGIYFKFFTASGAAKSIFKI